MQLSIKTDVYNNILKMGNKSDETSNNGNVE